MALQVKKILKKLDLIESFTTELDIQKDDFIKELKNQVEEANIGLFLFSSSFIEVFSSSNKKFKGQVKDGYFKIRKRLSFSDMNHSSIIASGSFKQKNDKLVIETEIMGFYGLKFFIYGYVLIMILILSIILFFMFYIFMADNIELTVKFIAVFFLFLQLLFAIGFPYLLFTQSMNSLKDDIKNLFYHMQKKQ